MPTHYAIVDDQGLVLSRGYGDILDNDDCAAGRRLVQCDKPVPRNVYWDGSALVPMGDAPSLAHRFDYATKSWVFDLGSALTHVRQWRDGMLAASDFVTLRAYEQGQLTPPEWRAYRQALRNLPAMFDDEDSFMALEWPQPPG